MMNLAFVELVVHGKKAKCWGASGLLGAMGGKS
jgi:hypothetical protein